MSFHFDANRFIHRIYAQLHRLKADSPENPVIMILLLPSTEKVMHSSLLGLKIVVQLLNEFICVDSVGCAGVCDALRRCHWAADAMHAGLKKNIRRAHIQLQNFGN
jgi:hypothetical protein